MFSSVIGKEELGHEKYLVISYALRYYGDSRPSGAPLDITAELKTDRLLSQISKPPQMPNVWPFDKI